MGLCGRWVYRSCPCKCIGLPLGYVRNTAHTLVVSSVRWPSLDSIKTDIHVLHRVKTRLQVQVKHKDGDVAHEGAEPHYTSTWDAITKIVADDGLSGLYNGISGSLLGVASTNFAYFYWYSTVRTWYFKSQKSAAPPSTAVELALGAVAGALAQACTIPVAVITTRQQTQSKADRKGFLETGREIIASEDGVSGLWRGLKASLVLVVNPSITYGAYERLKTRMFPGKTRLTAGEAFCEFNMQPLRIFC